MNNFISNIKNNLSRGNTKQKIFLLGSIIGVMVVIILVFVIISKFVTNKISYSALENKLEKATISYMEDYPNNLPTVSNPLVVVNLEDLISQKYIKELSKYVKDSSCDAKVNVTLENNEYKYQAYLTCNNYKTENLADVLKTNNVLSTFGEGLYEMNNEYVYRGDNPNNNITFADEEFKIVKIDSEGRILIILNKWDSNNYGYWDDRYNTEADSQRGNNSFSVSRALSAINNYYTSKYAEYNKYLVPYSLCIGKRSEVNVTKDGSFECSEKIDNNYIGLLPAYDYMNASLDNLCKETTSKECQNYNYLAKSNDKWWLQTANDKNTYYVYYVSYSGAIDSTDAASKGVYLYVLALDKNTLFKSGTGTEDDPYQIR